MIVYSTSPWIPAEWIQAHGFEPRGLWPAEAFQRQLPPLSAGICAFAEMAAQFAAAQPEAGGFEPDVALRLQINA